jgi:uncharacterized protein (TIRG00374 family)
MNKKIAFSLIFGIMASVGMLYLALRNVPMGDLVAYMGQISYIWFVPSVAFLIIAFVLRVVRWQIILKDSISLGFWKAFHPVMIGFMINCILPGRVGELARPAILKKQSGVALTTGLATVAVERIFDIFMLIILFAMIFSTVTSRPDLNVNFGGWHLDTQLLQSVAWAMIRMSIILLAGLMLFSLSTTRGWIMQSVDFIFRTIGRIGPKVQIRAQQANHLIHNLSDRFADGLRLVNNTRRALACSALTVLIWAISALSYWVFSFGCPGIGLNFVEMTTVMVVICFFIALPSAPGFWGLWEAGGIFALSLFGVTAKDAAGFTLINHAINLFPVIVIGLISALITSVNIVQISYGTGNNAELGLQNQRDTASEPS